jgi:hypothetical protein
MRIWAGLLASLVVLSSVTGCQKAETGVIVDVRDGGRFPSALAGTWKAEGHGWEFVFERDGTISSAVIDEGMLRVTPAKEVHTVELKNDGLGTYKLGQWTVQYSPHSRELAVEVVVDDFHLDMKTFGLKGQMDDWFVGPVSQDFRTWRAEWFSFPQYVALLPGEEESALAEDPNTNAIDTLVFRKQQ